MHELVTQFGIDWKLLLAQIVNFFVLLYLLKRFAYGPVMTMLATRRRKIAEGMKASDEAKEQLAHAHIKQQEMIREAHQNALGIVDAAEKEADKHAKNILDAAHAKSEQVIASGQKHLEEEKLKLSSEFEHSAQDLVKASLVKVIGKLEPAERDKHLIQEALKELHIVSKTS